jgi:FixJ family two-component response regulator
VTTVYIVDDDDSVRTALVRLMRSANMHVHSFACVNDFLDSNKTQEPSCVIADIRMPGNGGLTLPNLLAARGLTYPVIFLSAQDTEETRIAAKHAGGAGFFRKPVDAQALLDAIEWAIREENTNGQLSH